MLNKFELNTNLIGTSFFKKKIYQEMMGNYWEN